MSSTNREIDQLHMSNEANYGSRSAITMKSTLLTRRRILGLPNPEDQSFPSPTTQEPGVDITKSSSRFSTTEMTRRAFGIGLTTLLSGVVFPFLTPLRSAPSEERNRYQVYPNWMEDNLTGNIHLLNASGISDYLIALSSANPLLISGATDYMKNFTDRLHSKDRMLLGESYEIAYGIIVKRFSQIPDYAIKPSTNIRREIVHTMNITKARVENPNQKAADLVQIGVDLSHYKNLDFAPGSFFYDNKEGIATNIFPITFGHPFSHRKMAASTREWNKSYQGSDDQHPAHHGALVDIRAYDLSEERNKAPVANLLSWLTSDDNPITAAQKLSYLAGQVHEYIGTANPLNWPVPGNRPGEGKNEVGEDGVADIKRNILGAKIAARLIELANAPMDWATFNQQVNQLFSKLNDFRYRSKDTEPTLDLPLVQVTGL